MPPDLVASLEAHLNCADYIKGWEIDKRTCVGANRASLRKAARDAKAISSRGGPRWMSAIDKLRAELAKAQEADFDGLLSEALVELKRQPSGPITVKLPSEEAVALQLRAAAAHISRGDLAKGKRSYTSAEEAARKVRELAKQFDDAAAQFKKMRVAYASAVDALRVELDEIGEGDFDGLLRRAVRTLAAPNGPEELPDVSPTPPTPEVTSAAPRSAPALAAGAAHVPLAPALPPAPLSLDVEEVDSGLVWLGTLPAALQDALLRESFAPGALGVCGGLADGRGRADH